MYYINWNHWVTRGISSYRGAPRKAQLSHLLTHLPWHPRQRTTRYANILWFRLLFCSFRLWTFLLSSSGASGHRDTLWTNDVPPGQLRRLKMGHTSQTIQRPPLHLPSASRRSLSTCTCSEETVRCHLSGTQNSRQQLDPTSKGKYLYIVYPASF